MAVLDLYLSQTIRYSEMSVHPIYMYRCIHIEHAFKKSKRYLVPTLSVIQEER